jgi:hypothetical protein
MFRFRDTIITLMIINTCPFNMHTHNQIEKVPPVHFIVLAKDFKALVPIFFFKFIFLTPQCLNFQLP